jgi:hypothetical protein
MGGYQVTTIGGQEYLTLYDIMKPPEGASSWDEARGKEVEFQSGPVPRGWSLPTANILRVARGSRATVRLGRDREPRRLTRPLLDVALEATRRRDHSPGPSVKTIQDRLGAHFAHEGWNPKEAATTLKAAMDSLPPSRVLELANTILDGSGIEYIADAEDDAPYQTIGLHYVNMGDTYTATLLFDYRKGRYYATSWGSIVELSPRRFPS